MTCVNLGSLNVFHDKNNFAKPSIKLSMELAIEKEKTKQLELIKEIKKIELRLKINNKYEKTRHKSVDVYKMLSDNNWDDDKNEDEDEDEDINNNEEDEDINNNEEEDENEDDDDEDEDGG